MPSWQEAVALTHVTIAGRTLKVGKLDAKTRADAEPFRLRVEKIHIKGEGPPCVVAHYAMAQIAALLLRDHAPGISADWLHENMSVAQRESLMDEFLRQATDLANFRGGHKS